MTTKTPAKPRLSAAERAAQRLAEQAQAEAHFQLTREKTWQGLWARAMRLQLLLQSLHDEQLLDDFSWWFGAFKVNPQAQTFTCEAATEAVNEAGLTLKLAERVDSSLTTGQEYFDLYQERKAEEKRKREELAARKNEVLKKLTKDERELLNLPSVYHP